MSNIDFTDPKAQISPHFTVHDAIWLPSWNRLANESDGLTEAIKDNLEELFAKLEQVRDILGPLIVHVTYRPATYNAIIGGATHSGHIQGKCVDFHAADHSINDAKDLLLKNDLLEKLNLRQEAGTATWIHLGNDYTPGHNRIFQP